MHSCLTWPSVTWSKTQTSAHYSKRFISPEWVLREIGKHLPYCYKLNMPLVWGAKLHRSPLNQKKRCSVIYIFYVHVIPTAQIITGAILIAYCGKHRLDKMLVKLKLTVNIPVSYTTYNFLPRLEGVVGLTYLLRNALLYSAPMWLLA